MGKLRDMAIALGCDLDAPMRMPPEERKAMAALMAQPEHYRWDHDKQQWVGPFIRLNRPVKYRNYLEQTTRDKS